MICAVDGGPAAAEALSRISESSGGGDSDCWNGSGSDSDAELHVRSLTAQRARTVTVLPVTGQTPFYLARVQLSGCKILPQQASYLSWFKRPSVTQTSLKLIINFWNVVQHEFSPGVTLLGRQWKHEASYI